ncbi:MAG: CDP-alcohol phosphatidyltransferase family protein [Candidatus Nanopelagicales bacterium]
MTEPSMTEPSERVLTLPNALSFARILGVPVFLWLILVPQADLWALALLVLAGITDWLDGAIARATGQTSRLGAMLDPLADRLYIAATLLGLAVRSIIPWWLVGLLVLRELMLLALVPLLRRRGLFALPVTVTGKAATFCLMWGFPFLLLGSVGGSVGTAAMACGWAFALWGTGLYWWAGIGYVVTTLRMPAKP